VVKDLVGFFGGGGGIVKKDLTDSYCKHRTIRATC